MAAKAAVRRVGLAAALGMALTQMAPFSTAAASEREDLQRVHQLVNEYYGSSRKLEEASAILNRVLQANPPSAAAYFEAARITIKGGHIVSNEFRPGTRDTYKMLIDKALELDPNHAPTLALKAEWYLLSGNLSGALAAIEQGQRADPDWPWLKLQLAYYHLQRHDTSKALDAFDSLVLDRRCDTDPQEYRRACVAALGEELHLLGLPTNVDVVREVVQRLEKLRHPDDAWSLGEIAVTYMQMDRWDEAIDYSRKALAVMNYGVARRYLAIGLYTQAALLDEAGKPNAQVLREADALHFQQEDVLSFFAHLRSPARERVASVTRLFEQRAKAASQDRGTKPPPSKPALRS